MKYPISNHSIYHLANQFDNTNLKQLHSEYWSHYLTSGSHLWMDTGDIDSARELWTSEYSALTTNNTLLNLEVQKGVYDEAFVHLSKELKMDEHEVIVKEIAFCINAIHGLRLAHIFNCKVSVELHTDYADDILQTVEVGRRLHAIAPQSFIIKVPFTAAGLIAARKLHQTGIPVNMTLGFSVRQNVIASLVAKPVYCNVFVGRLGAYFVNNNLSDGVGIGEKVTIETQKCMRKINERGLANTKLIGASIRSASQLLSLAGTDVLTIPVKVIADAQKNGNVPTGSHINGAAFNIPVELIRQFNLKHLWQAREQEKEVAMRLAHKTPDTTDALIELFNDYGCHDIFPDFDNNEIQHLKNDGKIPVHNKWAGKIENYQVGIDTLMNKAGLLSFMNDQQQLDSKISSVL
ncbi:transaldolase [Carboxylicivirga mesophila]|uniref:Transaldolase n=1 Tax=Carboxylicivirga mesophila TaxID=1166478 RepID=A0ABS5KDE0_9BACT|nr:transaldolase family protein [Carboxylicivirga mesophila]MBS2212981.1 transaldolase [Carboxylicivirga mesophila]